MLHVIAIITAKPGQRAALLEAFREIIPAVRAEQGCIEYGPAVDAEGMGEPSFGADSFVVIEKWESKAALGAHAKSAHMKAYGEKTKEMVARRAVHVLDPV